MTDTQPTQAMGTSDRGDDGVSTPEAGGRTGGGESGGGAYKEPEQVEGDGKGFEGGQSKKTYHGTGDAEDGNGNANAPADHD